MILLNLKNTILRNIQVKFLSYSASLSPIKLFTVQKNLYNHEKYGYSKRKSILIKNGVCTKNFILEKI